MITVKRPARLFSFGDYSKSRPRDPPPGDRIDAQFIELIAAIQTTQDALAEIRRDDGALKNNSVTEHHLVDGLREKIVGDIQEKIAPIALTVSGTAAAARDAERNAQLFAKDAEAAVNVATQITSGLSALRARIESSASINTKAVDNADLFATESENWADYSKAQADNAIAAKDEALQWAEFLAGPVVNSLEAPAYIADSPFPHGLYYQPVQGGVAGLWSAKWWALYAQNIVGKTGIFYLGAWPAPPLGGEQNPDTGQVVPDPIPPGSFYFDTTTGKLNIWTGTAWSQPLSVGQGYQATYVYLATAGQTVFSGADSYGKTPVVGTSPSSVYVNGVRLIETSDFVIDAVGNTLTIAAGLTVNSMVQWDLLVPPDQIAPGAVNAFKINAVTPDGTTQNFPLKYNVSGSPVDAAVGDGVQLQVSLDGALQEPGVDYTASGNSIHFVTAPLATSHLWMVWYKPGA